MLIGLPKASGLVNFPIKSENICCCFSQIYTQTIHFKIVLIVQTIHHACQTGASFVVRERNSSSLS